MEQNETFVVQVSGMMCPHCEKRVKDAVESVPGVTIAVPSHEQGTVEVTGKAVDKASVVAAIKGAGYDVL